MPPPPLTGPTMTSAPEQRPLAPGAASAATRAADRAGVTVTELAEITTLAAAADLLDDVWGTEGYHAATPELLRGFSHSGNYVAGAYNGAELVGALVGYQGAWHGECVLHSHILGVRSDQRGRGVGAALKLHQRNWALQRGHRMITWTFDPLVRGNAGFNLSRLGAQAVEYLVNFYGRMNDGINNGDESDRLLVAWELDTARVRAVCDDERGDGHGPLLAEVSQCVLGHEDDGGPRLHDVEPGTTAALIDTPQDIVSLRQRDPALAMAWRMALRDAFVSCAARGMRPVRTTTRGEYVLVVDGPGFRVHRTPATE